MDVESILGEKEVWSRQTRFMVWKGHNFWSDCWILIKLLQDFLEVIFLVIDLESLLGEAPVWPRQTGLTVRKGHTFWSDRGIPIKLLQEFLEAIFHGVDLESLLVRRRSGPNKLE
jgi:hypothetical protein